MRLIDADAMFREIKNSDWLPHERINAMKMVREQPAIDAVPVVRCKDCIHSRPIDREDSYEDFFDDDCVWCMCSDMGKNNLDFCSYGERKEADG